jgi:integrase
MVAICSLIGKDPLGLNLRLSGRLATQLLLHYVDHAARPVLRVFPLGVRRLRREREGQARRSRQRARRPCPRKGHGAISGFSKFKRAFDEAVLAAQRAHDANAKPMPRWTLHDLRRTARSLMSRAGVAPDHAERALAHVIPGIRGTYDLHEFRDEKRRAMEALADQVERIINPQDNVIGLHSPESRPR